MTGDPLDRDATERLLTALGDLLDAREERCSIVVVGGVALAFGGFVERTTFDVDVIAVSNDEGTSADSAVPLPEVLLEAVTTVARDFDLESDWLNSVIGAQLELGVPPKLLEDAHWRTFGGLNVGFAGRRTLIALKLYAAADNEPGSKHVQDLVCLAPSTDEWADARAWVVQQDASTAFHSIVDEVIDHVRTHTNDR